jgi:hypothetical protein
VTTVRATDINVNLDLMLATGALVRPSHADLHLLSK